MYLVGYWHKAWLLTQGFDGQKLSSILYLQSSDHCLPCVEVPASPSALGGRPIPARWKKQISEMGNPIKLLNEKSKYKWHLPAKEAAVSAARAAMLKLKDPVAAANSLLSAGERKGGFGTPCTLLSKSSCSPVEDVEGGPWTQTSLNH